MNATRAATIRLRSSFDGAASRWAVCRRRHRPSSRAVKLRSGSSHPEPYWVVDARFLAPLGGEPQRGGEPRRAYEGRFSHAAYNPRISTAEEAAAIAMACDGGTGTITA